MYCVYAHINKITGKIYIGQTKQGSTNRWNQGYKDCPKFYNAIKKYGWDNFIHIVLVDNLTCEEANILEEEFIKKFDCIKNGYNIKNGGGNCEIAEETRKKISEKRSGQKASDSTRKILSDAHKGKTFNHKTSNKKVGCSNGKEYNSVTAASKDVGCNRVTVGNICNGRLDNWKGITFWFIE